MLFPKIRHIHFVGIGGIGMSGIAEVLLTLGYKVTGSDINASSNSRRLAEQGAIIYNNHNAENIGNAHVVVISSAIKSDNPEVLEAIKIGTPVIPRAEMLSELMRMKHGIAIAGAHGKTTTTSIIAMCLANAGLDPTVVIGGKVNALGSNAKLGQGDYLVAEADESDGSFLKLTPTIAVVTNIDPEHLDYYGSIEAIRQAFVNFMNKVPFYGTNIVCLDDANIRKILPDIKKRVITYGFSPQADLWADMISFDGLKTRFNVVRGDSVVGEVSLNMPGEHNVLNSLAAIISAEEVGIPFCKIAESLDSFAGVQRRFQKKGTASGVLVFDDYGHHPQEIIVTLKAARKSFPQRRLVVVFQPHRYSRTRDLFEEFVDSFSSAHEVCLLDIYPAGEDAIPSVSSHALYLKMKERFRKNTINYFKSKEELLSYLNEHLKNGDILLTLGAGDVWRVGEQFLHKKGALIEGSQV